MSSWNALIASLILLNGLCIAADRFLLNRQKSRLHDLLFTFWLRLDDAKIRNFHHAIASRTYAILRGLTRPWGKPLLGLFAIASLSVTVTMAALTVGAVLDSDSVFALYDFSKVSWQSAAQFGYLFAVNFLFDGLTLFLTMFFLRRIARRGWPLSSLLILGDGLSAAFLAALCAFCIIIWTLWGYGDIWGSGDIVNITGEGLPFLKYARLTFLEAVDLVLPSQLWSYATFDYTVIAYSYTTFFPTVLYLTALLVVVICKPILKVGKAFALFFVEKAVEVDDPKELMAFTLTGTLISTVALLLTAVLAFV